MCHKQHVKPLMTLYLVGFPVIDLLDSVYLLIYLYIMNGKQIIRKLENEGWHIKRVRGSHHIMSKDGRSVPVPVHGSTERGKGLLSAIEKQTGVKLK